MNEFIQIMLPHHVAVHYQRKTGQELKQGRNLEAGADAEAMEGATYTILHYMACSACSLIEPRTAGPRTAWLASKVLLKHPLSYVLITS